MRNWMYQFPGECYANGPVRAMTEKDARAEIRRVWDLTRLPQGTQVWATTPWW